MSQQALNEFRARLATDAVLQKACQTSLQAGNSEGLLALARDLGFEFDAQDVQECLNDGELSDFELELVSAGSTAHIGNFPSKNAVPFSIGHQ